MNRPPIRLVELVLATINRMRHFRNQYRRHLPTMIAFDVLELSQKDIDTMPKQLRWQVIDSIEQRIHAAQELEQLLGSCNFEYSLTDEIRDLKAVKLRVWHSLFPKFKSLIWLASETPQHA
jgi:hypothetical protein